MSRLDSKTANNKRAGIRRNRITAELETLRCWMHDLVHKGLAQLDDQAWQNIVARMVDAQIPGVGPCLEYCAELHQQGEGAQELLLHTLAGLYVLIDVHQNRHVLDSRIQANLDQRLGLQQRKSLLLKEGGVHDNRVILGHTGSLPLPPA